MSTTPARPLPPEVRDKLGKLLPLLSSNHDGERAGAAFAIERVLKSHGRDWHDLVAAITTATPAREPSRRQPTEDELGHHGRRGVGRSHHQAARQRRLARVHDRSNFSTGCLRAHAATTRSSSALGSDNGLMTSPAEPEFAS